MVEIKSIALDRTPISKFEIVNFSSVEDSRWSGIVLLPAHEKVPLDEGVRNEIYLLKGSLLEATIEFEAGTFLSRGAGCELHASGEGAVIFVYRDKLLGIGKDETITPNDREWHQGGAIGMSVAPLRHLHHRLMLVSWLPGTRVGFHSHPFGEEIFVLEGELIDQQGRYPVGTWQRLHPDSGHAPYVETKTLILLRNGHLHA